MYNEQLTAEPIVHWWCVNWLVAMPNRLTRWTFNLLETILPLSSWAPAKIKIQSELETVFPLNSWAPATITNQSQWHSTKGKRCSASILSLVNGHSTPLQRRTFAEALLHRLGYSIKTYLHKWKDKPSSTINSCSKFWKRCIGVVTPTCSQICGDPTNNQRLCIWRTNHGNADRSLTMYLLTRGNAKWRPTK